MKHDVIGLGNPLIDIIIHVDDHFLDQLSLEKGSMNLVDTSRQREILERGKHYDQKTTALGGSCANTMVMVSQLGGKAAYGGKLGVDDLADDYEEQLIKSGVTSLLKKQEGMTGSTIILVNPDAERTMNTHLGMCQAFSSSDLDAEAIQQSRILYVEGYLWDTPTQQEAVRAALKLAKEAGARIALTLSDSFCVERHKSEFLDLMEHFVDLIFCNEFEAEIITETDNHEDQLKKLAESVDHVVLTLGKSGSVVSARGEIMNIKAFNADAVDTTGAGDSFAAGYLYGITHDYSLIQSGNLASYCAASIVSQVGPRFKGDFRAKVEPFLVK